MKKDYLVLTIEIIQGIILIASLLYWINLTDQIIPLSQQIREYNQTENWRAALQLERTRSNLMSKLRWLSFATYLVVFALNEMPLLIRKINKWYQQRKEIKNRGEDQ